MKEKILEELKRQVAFSDDRMLNIEHFFNKLYDEVGRYGLKNLSEVSRQNHISLKVVIDIFELKEKE